MTALALYRALGTLLAAAPHAAGYTIVFVPLNDLAVGEHTDNVQAPQIYEDEVLI